MATETLLPFVVIDKRRVALQWRLVPGGETVSRTRTAFVYESTKPQLRLTWEWLIRSNSGPIEHTIRVQNLSGHEIWIPLQDSLAVQLAIPRDASLTHVFVEKGADTPSSEGTHARLVADGYSWTGFTSTYAHPVTGQAREIIPWSLIETGDHHGFYLGVEFSGRTRIALRRDESSLHMTAGLNPEPGPYRTRLRDHETFETPTVFLGAFTDGSDGAGNELRRWVRNVLGNPKTWADPHYPLLVSNSWGSGMAVNEAQALRMIHDASDLGLEMFHLDAGWFRAVGDWVPSPSKFPRGLRPIADAAHASGLKFGLWVDWAQAGLNPEHGALNARDPQICNWLVTDLPADWKPEEFKGETIDIGVPEAEQWAKRETNRIVRDYGLDMLEHDGYLVAQGCVQKDHPHAPPDPADLHIQQDSGFRFAYSNNSTDVSYRATRAYYEIQRHLREQHPGILLEICNDGGRMVDFGSAAHGDYFSITDTYDPLSNRRAFFDASHVLPPAMLETYVEKWETPRIESFRYMLRSGMMGWFSLMQDAATWTDAQRSVAKEEFAFYKSALRPLIREADLYHISDRPDGVHWDAIEYFDAQRGQGAIYIFHGTDPEEREHLFMLKGLNPEKVYRLHFRDGSSPDADTRGGILGNGGLRVKLPLPNSSEIVTITEEQT